MLAGAFKSCVSHFEVEPNKLVDAAIHASVLLYDMLYAIL